VPWDTDYLTLFNSAGRQYDLFISCIRSFSSIFPIFLIDPFVNTFLLTDTFGNN